MYNKNTPIDKIIILTKFVSKYNYPKAGIKETYVKYKRNVKLCNEK